LRDAKIVPMPQRKGLPDPEATLKLVLDALDDAKAEDTVAIELAGKTTLADHMVVASGRSQRHVGAVVEQVLEALSKAGLAANLRVDGKEYCDWVVLDQGDIILHVFRPEVRAFYNLEKMWGSDRPAERNQA
jgi:ribosome-associated protein